MDRKRFFFKQKVTASQLRAAFDDVENAQADFLRGFQYVGIVVGADVTETGLPNLSVSVTGPATIYDQNFKHIEWSPTQTVNCALDETGNATAVVTPSQEKWLSIFAEFQTYFSDPRIDGNGDTIYYEETESFRINVVQGGQAAVGTAMRPAMRGTQILLADVKLVFGQTAIVNANIDKTRTQLVYNLGGSPAGVKARSLQDALQQMLAVLNGFNASNISASAVSGTPYSLPNGTLATHITQLLANENTLSGQIASAVGGLNAVPAITDSPLSTTAGTIVNVLTQLLAHVNDDAALLARANVFSLLQTMNLGIVAVGANSNNTYAIDATGGGLDDGSRNTTGLRASGRGSKPGIEARGGLTGLGILATGHGTKAGVEAHGGSDVNDSGPGIYTVGGDGPGTGVEGEGSGIYAVGGAHGPGGLFKGGPDNHGVYAIADGSGYGVRGDASDDDSQSLGVYGNGKGGKAGVHGGHGNLGGIGVWALGQNGAKGLYAESNHHSGHAIHGKNTSTGSDAVAVRGDADNGAAVWGESVDGNGVVATSLGEGSALYVRATGTGGLPTDSRGIDVASAGNGATIYAHATGTGSGGEFESDNGTAVYAKSHNGTPIYAYKGGSGGTTGPVMFIENVAGGTRAVHINFRSTGMPSSPQQGDFWFANLKLYFYDGSNIREIQSVVV